MSASNRINKGVAALTQAKPDWKEKIGEEPITNLRDILVRVFGDELDARRALSIKGTYQLKQLGLMPYEDYKSLKGRNEIESLLKRWNVQAGTSVP